MTELNSLIKDRKRKKPDVDINTMLYGKVPPQAMDAEKSVLGVLLQFRDSFDVVSELLKPEMFYIESHQFIAREIFSLAASYKSFDIISVANELKKNELLEKIGGQYYLVTLTNNTDPVKVKQHSLIIMEKFLRRELIKESGFLCSEGYDESIDIFELLNKLGNAHSRITSNIIKSEAVSSGQVIAKAIQEIDNKRASGNEINGVYSGFQTIDRLTKGWQPTDLIILAARPSVGKTAFALNLARNAALHPLKPIPVGFFSLEMSSIQLIQRIMSAESEISMEKINTGRLDESEYSQLISKGVRKLEVAPIYIDDTAALSIEQFRVKSRRLQKKHNVGLIIVDYLQLMTGNKENREQEISTISRGLKACAKELGIPIIALSQLSRQLEARKEAEPRLSDLRESGAIEQDADLVAFIYRESLANNNEGNENPGETKIKFAKHRNGTLKTISLRSKLWIQKFEDMETTSGWVPVGKGTEFDEGITQQEDLKFS